MRTTIAITYAFAIAEACKDKVEALEVRLDDMVQELTLLWGDGNQQGSLITKIDEQVDAAIDGLTTKFEDQIDDLNIALSMEISKVMAEIQSLGVPLSISHRLEFI